METEKEPASRLPLPADSYATIAQTPAARSSIVAGYDPDNPPWSSPAAFGVWMASVFFILFIPVLAVLPYAFYKSGGAARDPQSLMRALTDSTAILISILSVIPAHLLTLGVVWAVVTGFGKRPLWPTLGWSWSERFGFWPSVGLAVLLLVVGVLVTWLAGGEKTQIDQLVANSTAARYSLALLAATTGPFVEELVYRGVLYSAFQRTIGTIWAVVFVSTLFTFVHVFQYYNNLGVIAVISILSISLTLVRAYTGRLLPCFVMHMVFNGIQSIFLIIEPHLPHSTPGDEQKAVALVHLMRAFYGLN
ncbi:MAG: CPBP family intramembrane metalloprotease [Pyrinomonadaceae bacterium]|nr:CPBP family intramembrane metalloprotease [Pyrinomonadaceae bacterium]